MKGDVHVLPNNDKKDHEESRLCWCRPGVSIFTKRKPALVVHNSLDGRELVERHGLN